MKNAVEAGLSPVAGLRSLSCTSCTQAHLMKIDVKPLLGRSYIYHCDSIVVRSGQKVQLVWLTYFYKRTWSYVLECFRVQIAFRWHRDQALHYQGRRRRPHNRWDGHVHRTPGRARRCRRALFTSPRKETRQDTWSTRLADCAPAIRPVSGRLAVGHPFVSHPVAVAGNRASSGPAEALLERRSGPSRARIFR